MKIRSMAWLCLSVVVVSGCSNRLEAGYARSEAFSGAEPAMQSAGRAPGAGKMAKVQDDASPDRGPGEPLNAGRTRKLVRNAAVRIRVPDPELMEEPLAALMERYEAYASSVNIHERFRNYTIRVPADSYEPFLAELTAMGRLLQRTENVEDVSLRFYDLEGRLATKQELLKTFQGYLGTAKTIEEIMTVEARLAELQREIDWAGTEFRTLANQVDYATVEPEFTAPPSTVSAAKPDLGERIDLLFRTFGDYVSLVLVVVVGIVVYGIPGILLLTLLFWVSFGRIGLLKKLWRLAAGGKTVKKTEKGFKVPEEGYRW